MIETRATALGPGRLKSPRMVAAVSAAAPPLKIGTPRDFVKTKRDLFERGMSEPNLLARRKQPLQRGLSCDSIRWRRENEAQRLVKYRSASSLASVDSGVSLSRSNSFFGSTEDMRHQPLSRSCSTERLPRRRSSACSTSSRYSVTSHYTSSGHHSSTLRRSSTSTSLHHEEGNVRRPGSHSGYHSPPSPDPLLPDLLPSPPPLPPKKRPPLPPRRCSTEVPPVPPRYQGRNNWDAFSDGESGDTSDVSLPEFLVDGEESLEGESGGNVRGNIPESFPFKAPLHKFLADLGQALSTEVVIKNVYGAEPGHLNLHAHTTPSPVPPPVYSMPQSTAPPRPPSLSPEAPHTQLSKKYRTELQVPGNKYK